MLKLINNTDSTTQFNADIKSVQDAISVIEARNCSGSLLGIMGNITINHSEWEYFKKLLLSEVK